MTTTLFAAEWDAGAGLWQSPGPGHTKPTRYLDGVHPGPTAASRLLGAAQLDRLAEVDTLAVLEALRRMQWRGDDDQHGCSAWYAEEDRPCDTNAAFFIALGLIPLRWRYTDRLPAGAVTILDDYLDHLKRWFLHACKEFACYYPNKFLGDLCCGWLLVERYGDDAERQMVGDRFRAAAYYYLDEEWGWGEHLSDGYSSVCLNELGMLLALAEKLPADVAALAAELLRELIDIDDATGGGPRLPALRSYAFDKSPQPHPYRDRVRPIAAGELETVRNLPLIGALLDEWGWHERFPRERGVAEDLSVPCFNGTLATVHQEPDIRLGSMSAFPIMPAIEHDTHGLQWQSFPVCFWRPAGDWGFLQWATAEHGTVHAQPAEQHDERHNPVLTNSVQPPIVARTHALQRGRNLLALRLLPTIAATWDWLEDRWRIVEPHGDARVLEPRGTWHQCLLAWPERTAGIQYVDLYADGPTPELVEHDGVRDWTVRRDRAGLVGRRIVLELWGISLDGEVTTAPEIRGHHPVGRIHAPEQRVWEIDWVWPTHTWHVHVDPRAAEPLAFSG